MARTVTMKAARCAGLRAIILAGVASATLATPAMAQDPALIERLEALEQKFRSLEEENQALKQEVRSLRSDAAQQVADPVQVTAVADEGVSSETSPAASTRYSDSIGISSAYAFAVLDQGANVNSKPLVQLDALRTSQLDDRVTLSGQITAISNFQWSNRASKFGYLMRNPTSANQIGKSVSEALIHSANLAVTARVTNDVTAYAELLYDPEQSFGSGTITALTRNQIQLRRGWVMWGNLEKSPIYALVGKMDAPFGLNDTVSPFTNSTNWHAFAPLVFGAQIGLHLAGFDVRAMAVQGGAQFRSANAPVQGTAVPSRLNNFAVDMRYTFDFKGEGNSLMVGGSYINGTAYCQGYPVFHFNPCDDSNPGIAVYGKLDFGPFRLIGEYAQATDAWPGSNVPDPLNALSVFPAVKTKAFTVGGRYAFGEAISGDQRRAFAVSGEFSKFIAGAEGAPWERQNQAVFGLSWFAEDNMNLFGEFIHVDGFAPLNFLSGGNFPDGSTWSDRDAATNVILIGATAAF